MTARFVFKAVKLRRYRMMAAFAACGVLAGALVMTLILSFEFKTPAVTTLSEFEVASTTAITMTKAVPERLVIDAVGIDAAFEAPLGLQSNQEIAVPEGFDSVGYYKFGPTPGEIGPAVVLGHVDSYLGPAVFWKLGKLVAGDTIRIERTDGSVAIFTVTKSERPLQEGFPTAEVYGDLDYAGLRLITCSGFYDKGTQRYSHNLIVFAQLTGTSTTAQL